MRRVLILPLQEHTAEFVLNFVPIKEQRHPQNDPCKLPHDPSITSRCQVKEGAEVKAIIIKTGT